MHEPSSPSPRLLQVRGRAQESLHQQASSLAADRFGNQVFIRAVVEVSNFCRENCSYCGMRRDNDGLARYRARLEQLAEMLIHHRPGSITDLNIQTGEDPVAVRDIVLPLIKILRRETKLGISVCLGTLNKALYQELFAAGASIYIIKFETANEQLYQNLNAPGTLEERLSHIRLLAESGWKVSSGFIAGLPGQTDKDIMTSLELAKRLPLAGCSVSPFIPGEATPVSEAPTGDIETTLNAMAMMRLMRPNWVIPAVSALNLAEPVTGYRRGLRTGANLVTINLTPEPVRQDYLLYKRERFIMTEERILQAIEAEGLNPSRGSLADHYRQKVNGHAHQSAAPLQTLN